MDKSDFFYELPQSFIAQRPVRPRDSSKLMCLSRASDTVEHLRFSDIADRLESGDLLVVNDSKVIPARLMGRKRGGSAETETLLLRNLGGDRWECAVRPGKRLKEGTVIDFSEDFHGEIEEIADGGNRIIRMCYDKSNNFYALLDAVGTMPLPRYIKTAVKDSSDYQTVYADSPGSAAAPTAGFHFTDDLLGRLKAKGVGIAGLTLHVGLGTFRPVKENNILDHIMHREYYTVPERTAEMVRETKSRGGRVVAVGTTTCRTLEAAADNDGNVAAGSSSTDIFIYPGYSFKVIDALITNFHLPESTLIMLVSAFLGYEKTMSAYRTAIDKNYRFYSFGDAMFIS